MTWKSEVDSTFEYSAKSTNTHPIAEHLKTSKTNALLQLSIWQKHGYIRQRGLVGTALIYATYIDTSTYRVKLWTTTKS